MGIRCVPPTANLNDGEKAKGVKKEGLGGGGAHVIPHYPHDILTMKQGHNQKAREYDKGHINSWHVSNYSAYFVCCSS